MKRSVMTPAGAVIKPVRGHVPATAAVVTGRRLVTVAVMGMVRRRARQAMVVAMAHRRHPGRRAVITTCRPVRVGTTAVTSPVLLAG